MRAVVFVYIIKEVAHTHVQNSPLEWFSSTPGLGVVTRLLSEICWLRIRWSIFLIDWMGIWFCLFIQLFEGLYYNLFKRLQWWKADWQVWWERSSKNINGEIFEGELLTITLPTSLLQMFCKTILNMRDIVKSIINSNENLKNLLNMNGLTYRSLEISLTSIILTYNTFESSKWSIHS